MTLEYIFNQAGIPLLLFAICIFYGIRLLITKDASGLRGKGKGPAKDEKAYAKAGGILILLYGTATLVMAGLLFVNVYAAMAEIVLCTVIMGVCWKRMNDRYGC